jgi:predicted GNAT family acetyltransferase
MPGFPRRLPGRSGRHCKEQADAVEWAEKAQLSELIGAVAPDEADESGVADLPRAAVIREDGRIVAAAGWAPWPARTAHLCVLTAPAARGRGLATRVAATATTDALAVGMLGATAWSG